MDSLENSATDYRARIYERYASGFQSAPSVFDIDSARRWGRAYRYYLRDWLPRDPDARIVDVACGGGRLLQFYVDAGYRNGWGVDVSPEQVMLSRQVTPNVIEENALSFLANQSSDFDLISGLDIIEHFCKPEVLEFLDLCFGRLKPGGRLILQTPNAESPWGTHHRYNDLTHELAFNPNSISRLLTLVGFESVEAREVGPVPWGYGARSSFRWLGWQAIRAALKFWNLVETGSSGSGVFSRVFLITAKRPI
jgi:2-polyprenyl-3-methyl-5-hydroxy-6-metoxy-1,4-benzoquinol methylase